MKRETFAQPKSRLKDPNFFAQLQEAVAERLDELATDPTLDKAGFPLDLGEKIRSGAKVSGGRMIRDAIIGIGEDFRLTRDEIDVLKNIFLKDKNSK